jgi:ATP-dependent helicase HepA
VCSTSAFVRVPSNGLGVGKFLGCNKRTSRVSYFVSPAHEPREEAAKCKELVPVKLARQTRVFHREPKAKAWRAGRVLMETGPGYEVAFPKQVREILPSGELFVRCDVPVGDPTPYLAHRVAESPFFHHRRAAFYQALAEQRTASGGLTGLLSAAVDLVPHQINVVSRVLRDPVRRYLLADEVGLGKTIEAGVLIRQFVLDRPDGPGVLVLVPGHLAGQWRDELTNRIRLGPWLDTERVRIADPATLKKPKGEVGMVVIDEAHHLTGWVREPAGSPLRTQFELARKLALAADELLLLSATPVLHNEDAYQAMLHFLDPAVYPLGDMKGFRARLAKWVQVAELFHLFSEDEAGPLLEEHLGRLLDQFPKDERLKRFAKQLRPLLDFLHPVEDPVRRKLIRAVRTHLSETYRLHRRLLRNRRGMVEGIVSGRAGYRYKGYADPDRGKLAQALDEWRAAVAAGTSEEAQGQAGDVLKLFADAAAADPQALAALVEARIKDKEAPAESLGLPPAELAPLLALPRVRGEGPLLKALQQAAAGAADARPAALVDLLKQLLADGQPKERKAIVFVSYPPTADRLVKQLKAVFYDAVARHSRSDEWRATFLIDPKVRILVCDRTAEDGLNLQGEARVMVHYDLPLSPNRIEQRVGRLDRYGSGDPVVSHVLGARENPYEGAWIDCLGQTYRIFGRSVASLQFLIDEQVRQLRPALLKDGSDAISRSAGEEGGGWAKVVEEEFATVRRLDELDAIDAVPDAAGFSELGMATRDREEQDEWWRALADWVGGALHFDLWGLTGPSDKVVRVRYQPGPTGRETLIDVGRLARHFAGLLRRDTELPWPPGPRHPTGLYSESLSGFRGLAQNRGADLARVGHPLIDGLTNYFQWDDRGVCSALWRFRPKSKAAKPAELYFRFDYLVEADVAPARKAMAKDPQASPEGTRRQADALFPPRWATVWLDAGLKRVTDPGKLALLEGDYCKDANPAHGRDHNVEGAMWATVAEHLPSVKPGPWAKLCAKAREKSLEALGEAIGLDAAAEAAAAHAKELAELQAEQLTSRAAHVPAKQRKAEEAELARHRRWSKALAEGIRKPQVRLTSLGAVFLADWSPFLE